MSDANIRPIGRSTRGPAIALACAVVSFAAAPPTAATDLPVSCAVAGCGTAGSKFATQGAATLAALGKSLTVTQTTAAATLNWASFNVSADATVNFVQPSTSSVALNRIFQADASKIFGTLNSNGTIYLLNQNGFLFGRTAVVNVGGLLASSLNISADALNLGIGNASSVSSPAFQPYTSAAGKSLVSGDITVQNGAKIDSAGGQVLLFAPNVENAGSISTPDGQTIIGAGQRVFLAVSTDPSVRGLLIEVGSGGTATNDGAGGAAGGVGEIIANRGNVTLAGAAVNQNGRLSASTTTRVNGSIILQARDTSATQLSLPGRLQYTRTGALSLGADSVTQVTLEGSATDTTVDATVQPKSTVRLSGGAVTLADRARITATGGTVTVTAAGPAGVTNGTADASRIWLAPDSVIDVSGATVSQSVSLNSLSVQLRGSELANNPAQRDGPLRGTTVWVDMRNYGVDANGNAWVGTPIADLTGDVSTLQRDVFLRNLSGGTVTLNSSGSVIQSPGSVINVTGGQIDWQTGYVKSSVLLGTNGVAYNIAAADPNGSYVGTLDSISTSDPHWGTAATAASFGRDPRGVYTQGYVEGKDAGSLTVVAPAVVLDGALAGQATRGLLQRLPATALPAGQLYRSFDQVPLGGQLVLGNAAAVSDTSQFEVLGSVFFGTSAVLAGLSGPGGAAFDPAHDALPATLPSEVRGDLLTGGGFTRLAIYSEREIVLPFGQTLALGAGSAITLDAGRVLLAGGISAPAGSVSIAALPTEVYNGAFGLPLPGLFASPGAWIGAAGEWVNDNPIVTPGQTLPLYTAGGRVSLSSLNGELVLPAGVSVDVSGGAYDRISGAVVAGAGGSIVISDQPGPFFGAPGESTVFAPTLTGFAIAKGGSLSIGLGAICLSVVACVDPQAIHIAPELLNQFGFASIALTSTVTGLEVAGDVNVHVEQANLQLPGNVSSLASAPSLAGIGRVAVLPDYQRAAASLVLTSSTPFAPDVLHADLLIAEGARIETDALGSITLKTTARIIDEGTLVAPGGKVTLDIVPYVGPNGFRTDQALWLGPNAVIDVGGVAIYTPNSLGLQIGKVLGGGSISLLAESGYLIAPSGAQLDARGASGIVDVRTSASSTSYQRSVLASAGGSITLFGAEGLQFDAAMHADAGGAGTLTQVQAPGGSLTVSLNGDLGSGSARSLDSFPSTPRVLSITTASETTAVSEGGVIPLAINGKGSLSAALINAGGFDQVSLSAGDLLASNGSAPITVAVGSVAFESGVALAPRVSLVVNAGDITARGAGLVSLSAPYVALGSSDVLTQLTYPTPTPGTAMLEVSASQLDLVGASSLSGFASEILASAGDIRAVGVQTQGLSSYLGRLVSGGALSLIAQQIYPTSLTNYSITLAGNDRTHGVLAISTASGTAGPALSAGGSLALTATTINDAGVLRAPFGALTLNAATVNLEAGSVTSVSGAGTDVFFGETQGGLAWIYPLSPQITSVLGVVGATALPPQKQLSVNAATFNLQRGAVVDVAGGGELKAFEFTAGTGGTVDVLSNLTNPTLYAVLPGRQLAAAPIDPLLSAGFNLAPGTSVYLAGGNGLAPGIYTLLPARYALLPGAFLVKAVAGYTDIAASAPVHLFDGSVVMAGYQVAGSSGLGVTRASGFDVMPGSYAYRQANYMLTSADTFFASQAQSAAVAAPRLPADAGSISISATLAAVLLGTVDASHPTVGSRGASVDFSAANLYVSSNATAAPAGYVTLDPTQLNALGAESLLIGGTRAAVAGGTALSVGAGNVVVGPGANLTGQEIVLAGRASVQLLGGATVVASGAAVPLEPVLFVPAGTALVRASTGGQETFSVTGSGGTGAVTVASGATLGAPGSVTFNSAGIVNFQGSLLADGASVRLSSTLIGIGPVPTGFNGFALTPALITGLGSANLELASSGGIEFFGNTTLSLSRLALLAPGLVAETPGATLDITAKDVVLGSVGTVATPPTAGSGSLLINASTLHLAGGAFGVAGVASSSLQATTAVVAEGDGSFTTAGTLSIATPVMLSRGAYNVALTAAGAFSLTSLAAGSGPVPVAAPGGQFVLQGTSVLLDSAIRTPAGQVLATATSGDVTLGSHAQLDVGGYARTFDGQTVSANGGQVRLVSTNGNIAVDSAAVVDVSAGEGTGRGGMLSLTASRGTVGLAGKFHGTGGAALVVDGKAFDPTALLTLAGAFAGDLTARLRGVGDLVIPSGQVLRTGDVALTVDQGSIRVAGTLDASGPNGHTVELAALNDVRVDGSILATATATATRGGTIDLYSTRGGVYLASGSRLAVGGTDASKATPVTTATGTVLIRLPANSALSVLNTDPATRQLQLGGAIAGAGHVVVEGYQSYAVGSTVTSLMTSPDPANPLYADVAIFAGYGTAIAAALGRGSDPTFEVVPGIELRTTGDLHLANAWDLSIVNVGPNGEAWRFGDQLTTPGVLTLRAGGSLYIDQSLSDGFYGLDPYNGGYQLFPGLGESWSYRLVAGADFSASQPLAVSAAGQLAASAGNVVVAPGLPSDPYNVNGPTVVRTGTGFIDVAAGRNLTLGNQASVIYTAGMPSPNGLPLLDSDSGLIGYSYPTAGGSVRISAGLDIVGAPNNQLFTDWLWRAGSAAGTQSAYAPTAWLVSYGNFEQGIGAFGGGDLSVVAGRNIIDLGANVPTIGVPVGDGTATGTTTQAWGSGLLTVQAGGDILGGKFLGMAAGAAVTAGGAIGLSPSGGNRALNPLLALGADSFDVTARRNLTVEAVLNPTLLTRSLLQPVSNPLQPELYSTYTDSSRVVLTSVGGDVILANRTAASDPLAVGLGYVGFSGFLGGYAPALAIYAPSVTVDALAGNVRVQGSMALWPSPHGTLDLYAANSVIFSTLSGRGSITVTQSDMDPALIGTPALPGSSLAPLFLLNSASYYAAGTHAATPMHGGAYATDGLPDTVPNRIVALDGSVAMMSGDTGNRSALLSAKPIDISAGLDIVDLGLYAQNIAPDSVDALIAGRDFFYNAGRTPTGVLQQNSRLIDVSGPGELIIQAGRSVNLQTSNGITTSGNLANSVLGPAGADIAVMAGVGAAPQYAPFIAKYVAGESTYDAQLIDYVTRLTGTKPATKAAALAAYTALTTDQQVGLVTELFIAELRAGGRAAAAAGPGHNDFTRAFTALDTLFPGSNPDLAKGQTNPYAGDILLYFSRIYTLSGGNIDLYAPGGEINVGLAAAPSTFGIKKSPAELGIVAQGTGSVSEVAYTDVQVNQSRIFAANGGNILIWSTDGNIDAGRGAKTAISAPPPIVRVDANGQVTSVFPAALTGSGIQTIATSAGVLPGDVDLFAPHGVVNANDAGIVAGNLTIAATAVLGAANISFSGTAVGVPVQSTGLGASLASAASSGTAASGLNGSGMEGGDKASSKAPLAETALNWLEVFVTGLGEDACRPDDLECLRRQKHN